VPTQRLEAGVSSMLQKDDIYGGISLEEDACCDSYFAGNSTNRCCPPPPTFECCLDDNSPECCTAIDDITNSSDLIDYLEENEPCCTPPPTFECCAEAEAEADSPKCCGALGTITNPGDLMAYLQKNDPCCPVPQGLQCCLPAYDIKVRQSRIGGLSLLSLEETDACCGSYFAGKSTDPCCSPPTTTSTSSTTLATTSTTTVTLATTATTTLTTTTTILPTFNVIRNPGSVSINAEVCKGTPEDIAQFLSGFVSSMLLTVCGGPCDNVGIENVSICGQRINQNLTIISGRRLQDGQGSWQATYDLVTTTLCGAAGCASETDTVNANTIANRVADTVRNAIQSGSFASTLSSNSDVVASLGSSALSCLVAWGTMHEATTTLTDISGDPVLNDPVSNANVSQPYYPDWKFYSGTCKNDGFEPTYMKITPSDWLYDSLEACCESYYGGWNKPKCLDNQGSGMWFVDHILGKCRTDCEEGNGVTCGGLANPVSDDLFVDPIDCCENKLNWVFAEWCEADSLEIDCYCGSGKYYRGTEVCVKDCDASCSGGDSTCGGIVMASDVVLHESATACCAEHFDWIENELCAARSDATPIEKYWPDKAKSKCFKDSETPATDLSVSLYTTAKECCSEIPWVNLSDCV